MTEKKYLFRIVVKTPDHGEFAGNWAQYTTEEMAEGKAVIKDNWGDLAYMTLTVDETEVLIPSEVLCQSIVIFDMMDCDD